MKKALSREAVKLFYILSLVVFLVPVVSAETVLVSDDFENSWNGGDGWLSDWYHQGDSAIVSNDPYEGSYSLRLGRNNGWPGERWLNISDPRVLDIMKNRMDLGIDKGCDGFDPDNMDGYSNNTGFSLTEQDSIDYYNALADYAHFNGKQIGLKNALTIIDNVIENIDWAVNEQCFNYNECFYLDSVLDIGKPVFNIEYGDESKADEVCDIANEKGFTTFIKNMQLDEFEISCLDWDGGVPPDNCTADVWDTGKTYFKRDIISHNNHEWKAKNTNQGVEPGTNKRYWTDLGLCN